jgi:hypothetical protein
MRSLSFYLCIIFNNWPFIYDSKNHGSLKSHSFQLYDLHLSSNYKCVPWFTANVYYLGPNSMLENFNLVEIIFLLAYHCTLSMQTHCHVLLIKASNFMVNLIFYVWLNEDAKKNLTIIYCNYIIKINLDV